MLHTYKTFCAKKLITVIRR